MKADKTLAICNFLSSLLLGAIGIYDVTHDLPGFGGFMLWASGGNFAAALHCWSKYRSDPATNGKKAG